MTNNELPPELTSKLTLAKSDMLVFQMAMGAVSNETQKFMFADISNDNLNYIAQQTTYVAKRVFGDRRLLDLGTGYFYTFKYISVKVNIKNQEVSWTPMFERSEKFCSSSINLGI